MNWENKEKLKQRFQNKYYGGKSCLVLWVSISLCEILCDYCPNGKYEKSLIGTFDEKYNPIKIKELSSLFSS